MLTPDDRGTRWLQTKVQQLLADSAVPLAPASAEDRPACYWGAGWETSTTLYLCLAGDPEPKALRFKRSTIADCGAGRYAAQRNALLWIRRTLIKMGVLST
jgi:hypothetical protein